PAMSPDLTRLAYVSTDRRADIVYRTALVLRDLRNGRTRSIPFGPSVPMGTPPELVINWSPDGGRVAVFDGDRIRLVDVASARNVMSQPSVEGGSNYTPPLAQLSWTQTSSSFSPTAALAPRNSWRSDSASARVLR